MKSLFGDIMQFNIIGIFGEREREKEREREREFSLLSSFSPNIPIILNC